MLHHASFNFDGRDCVFVDSKSQLKICSGLKSDLEAIKNGDIGDVVPKDSDMLFTSQSWAPPQFGACFAAVCFKKASGDAQNPPILPARSGVLVYYNEILHEEKRWKKCTDDFIDEHWKMLGSEVMCKDVKFAPASLGLRLAAIYDDGYVRFYAAVELVTFSEWRLEEAFPMIEKKDSSLNTKCSRLCWNNDPSSKPLLAVGNNSGNITIYGDNNEEFIHTSWDVICEFVMDSNFKIFDIAWAHPMGNSYSFIAVVTEDTSFSVRAGGGGMSLGNEKSKINVHILRFDKNKISEEEKISLSADTVPICLFWNSTGTKVSIQCSNGDRLSWRQDLFDRKIWTLDNN